MDRSAPVIVSGVGGSGTRVIAELLEQSGFFLGNDLGVARDNLSFTLLFLRPRWHGRRLSSADDGIKQGLDIFTRANFGHRVSSTESRFVFKAAATIDGIWNPYWKWRRMRYFMNPEPPPSGPRAPTRWVIKEPMAHIYMDELVDYYPDLKWIHVIRHGLDMAYSRNQYQVRHWGPLFGVARPRSAEDRLRTSLEYWVRANQRVSEKGKALGDGQFLMVNYDELCRTAQPVVEHILTFLGADLAEDEVARLGRIPQPSSSSHRYVGRDLDVFRQEDLAAVREFGFEIRGG